MIDAEDFAAIRRRMEAFDETRERIIKRSRDILKASKHAIYSLHREEPGEAARSIEEARGVVSELLELTKEDPLLRQQGALTSAFEEYVEARAFHQYLSTGTLLPLADMQGIRDEEYLCGLADLTGELMRHAILRATAGDKEAVQSARDLIDAIHGELSQFDFRNSELRRKYDSIKYNLQKVEQALYDLHTKRGA